MSDNLFVKKGTFTSLPDVVKSICELSGCVKIERHDSVNYWGGQYFLCRLHDATLTIALADEVGFEEYDYWLSLEIDSQRVDDEIALAEKLARMLALNGFETARPFSKEDWLYKKATVKRIVYRKKQQTSYDSAESTAPVEERVEEVSRS